MFCPSNHLCCFFFFFQAEDGIRDAMVTGVQTCALPISPTDKAAAAMQRYGLNVYDANGNMLDIYAIAGQLQERFGGLTQQERNAAFATIFGNDAMRAANALYAQGEKGLRELNKQMLAQADAGAVAATKTDNLAGDIEQLTGSLETLFITSGEGANSGLRFIVEALTTLVNRFAALPGPVQTAVVVIAGLSGTGLLAAAAFMKF